MTKNKVIDFKKIGKDKKPPTNPLNLVEYAEEVLGDEMNDELKVILESVQENDERLSKFITNIDKELFTRAKDDDAEDILEDFISELGHTSIKQACLAINRKDTVFRNVIVYFLCMILSINYVGYGDESMSDRDKNKYDGAHVYVYIQCFRRIYELLKVKFEDPKLKKYKK